jgi:predicted hydrocarbon binding protein
MHCHHYSTLFSQLADDAQMFQGPKLLSDASEESFYPVLVKYFQENNVSSIEERAAIAEQYFSFIGLGQIQINVTDQDCSAQMKHSHVDEGWIKKWGKRDEPVNFIGQGYLAAAFSAINGQECGSYKVQETQSIVSGQTTSQFTITRK